MIGYVSEDIVEDTKRSLVLRDHDLDTYIVRHNDSY